LSQIRKLELSRRTAGLIKAGRCHRVRSGGDTSKETIRMAVASAGRVCRVSSRRPALMEVPTVPAGPGAHTRASRGVSGFRVEIAGQSDLHQVSQPIRGEKSDGTPNWRPGSMFPRNHFQARGMCRYCAADGPTSLRREWSPQVRLRSMSRRRCSLQGLDEEMVTQTGRTRGSSGLGVSLVVGYSPLWILHEAEWKDRIVRLERGEVRQGTVQSLRS